MPGAELQVADPSHPLSPGHRQETAKAAKGQLWAEAGPEKEEYRAESSTVVCSGCLTGRGAFQRGRGKYR